MKPLDSIHFDECRADYERRTVPPEVPADEFGRIQVNLAYAAGFGACIAIAQRLQGETIGTREGFLARMSQEIERWALDQDKPGSMPQA